MQLVALQCDALEIGAIENTRKNEWEHVLIDIDHFIPLLYCLLPSIL